jgi:hypothetical protein
VVNYEDVTLCKLALAGTLYNSLTTFNRSLGRLNKATGYCMNLTDPQHRIYLLTWLNEWGCRNLPKEQHDVASDSISKWYEIYGTSLFSKEKPLWELADGDLKKTAYSYGFLKDEIGAWRVRGKSKRKVHIGPTASSKVLFVLRPKALMPWDEAMRKHFGCSGNPGSYFKYLIIIRNLTLHLENLCRNKGFQIDDLPQRLGRSNYTVLALINEYIWVTVTRKVELPSSETLMQWASLG